MILLRCCQKVNSSLTLGHNAFIIHLTSSLRHFIISCHQKEKGEHSTIRYLGETTFISLLWQCSCSAFIVSYCYSSLTVPNLYVKPYHRYVYIRKKTKQLCVGLSTICSFKYPVGVLECTHPLRWGRPSVLFDCLKFAMTSRATSCWRSGLAHC